MACAIQCFHAPCPCNVGDQMDATDWVQFGTMIDDSAMNWYALTHPGTSLPAPAPGAVVSLPGVHASFNTNLLIIGAVIVAAVLLLK